MLFRQGEDVECVSTFRKVNLRTELRGKASQDALVRSWDGAKLSATSLVGAGNPFQILERQRYASYVFKLGTLR